MDPAIRTALGTSQVIDLTTTGRRSGEARRIEIYLHNLGGRLVISGMPNPDRTRAWLRNVVDNPSVTLHLKQGVVADVPGVARVVTDPAERAELLAGVARNWNRTDLEAMQAHSPLMEVVVEGYPG
ncbi:MAG: nitroreductase family deazaflavin-dependent oxidoreductase [Chloroflexota bacterium]